MASSPLTFATARPLLRDPGVVTAIANTPPTILWRRGTRVSPSLADIGDGSSGEVRYAFRFSHRRRRTHRVSTARRSSRRDRLVRGPMVIPEARVAARNARSTSSGHGAPHSACQYKFARFFRISISFKKPINGSQSSTTPISSKCLGVSIRMWGTR